MKLTEALRMPMEVQNAIAWTTPGDTGYTLVQQKKRYFKTCYSNQSVIRDQRAGKLQIEEHAKILGKDVGRTMQNRKFNLFFFFADSVIT